MPARMRHPRLHLPLPLRKTGANGRDAARCSDDRLRTGQQDDLRPGGQTALTPELADDTTTMHDTARPNAAQPPNRTLACVAARITLTGSVIAGWSGLQQVT